MNLSCQRRSHRNGHIIIEACLAVILLTAAAAFQFQSFTTTIYQTAHATDTATAQAWLDNFEALVASGTVTSTGAITLSPTLRQGITITPSEQTFSNIPIGVGRNAAARFNATITTQLFNRGNTGNTTLFEYSVKVTSTRRRTGGSQVPVTYQRSILRQVQR